MIDIHKMCPGDIIVRDLCSYDDAEVPCMVISCICRGRFTKVNDIAWAGKLYELLVLYTTENGRSFLDTLTIDTSDAPSILSEYRILLVCK